MLKTIYTRAWKVLMQKPLKLWGISLLCTLLTGASALLCGIPILALAVSLLLTTSMTMIYLRGYRGEEVQTTQLFVCFRDWATVKRVLCGMGWMALWIFLWALIPVVGIVFAIIRTYEYRLVPYILITEPEVAPTEAIQLSKARTQGYKGQMFLADFLVGAAVFAALMLLSLLSNLPYIRFLFVLAAFVLNLAAAALQPLFLGLVQAAFYEEIRNPTVVPAPAVSIPVAPGAASNFCPNCGTPITAGSVFCPNCGNKL